MENKYNQKLTPLANQLRKSMTEEERHLWYDFLRDYPIRFYRQKVLGRYIVDFYCAKAHLVLELDGSQHFEPAGMRYDEERTKEPLNNSAAAGWRVFCPIRSVLKLGNTQSIPPILVLSAEPKSLATSSCRIIQRFPKYLQQFQLDVLRIPNNAVMDNFSGVCQWIDNEVRKRIPIPDAGGIAK